MRHHHLLAALRLPGNVERELQMLQEEVFALCGAISSQALPPMIPIVALPLSTQGHDPPVQSLQQAIQLRSPLVLEPPRRRSGSLCLDTGLHVSCSHGAEPRAQDGPFDPVSPSPPGEPITESLPSPLEELRFFVFLAGADSATSTGAGPGTEDPIAASLRRSWAKLTGESRDYRMTVRTVRLELWELRSEATPWWTNVDWNILTRRTIRLTRTRCG